MKRLTKRLPNGVIHVDFAKQKESVMGRLAAIEDILGDEYGLDRLRDLVQADREGRCVVLPVKPGTPVWSTAFCKFDDDGTEHPTYPWPFDIRMANDWGTEWFLTQEKAEAALRREQE